jgi:hypothetical protein
MAPKGSKNCPAKTLRDAQRNRERILEIAFARSGAYTGFDDLARQAGVAGGRYIALPYARWLLEAVYHTEVEKRAAPEREPSEESASVEVLRTCCS